MQEKIQIFINFFICISGFVKILCLLIQNANIRLSYNYFNLKPNQFFFDQKIQYINQEKQFYCLQQKKVKKMVKLSFTVYVPAPLPKVWDFFSKFENVPKWDPNTPSVIPKNVTPNKIGTLYDVKTLFKGSEKQMQYKMVDYQEHRKIMVVGENMTTKTIDQIIFEEKTPGTNVTYIADIQLKHVLKLFTPFIRKDLDELAASAQRGFRNKSRQLFGA